MTDTGHGTRPVSGTRQSPPTRRPPLTRLQLRELTGRTLPDLIPDPTRLLIVGINPGLRSVAVQAHFAPRGNRFYPALLRAGVVDRAIDASAGFDPADLAHLKDRGVGITCIVPGATAKAADLAPDELRRGARGLRERVAGIRPRVVALLGISAYRIAFDQPHASVGRQPFEWDGTEVWVVPNPSGLNRHYSVTDLAEAYRQVAVRAGIVPFAPAGA